MPLQQKIRAALPQGTHAGGLLGGWRRLAIAASLFLAGSLLGFFTSVLVTAESRDRADQADLAMRVGMCCDLAREVLPDQRMHGGYEEAASALQAVFPGARLPKLAGQAVPSPCLFGTATMESSRMNWVVFCDGDPSMRQRFLLLTVESVGSEGVGLGLREMELEQGDLRVIVWRDEGFFRVLITQRELDWAREQRRALRIV